MGQLGPDVQAVSVYGATKADVTTFSDRLRMEVAPKHNIWVTCIQPRAVATELYDHITDQGYRAQMEELPRQMTFPEGEDIADTILFSLRAPQRMDVAELFVMPTQQGW